MFAPRLDRFGDELPQDAIARYGTTRFRHGRPEAKPRWAPDGRLLATSRAGGVDLWDARSGVWVRALEKPSSVVFPAAVDAVTFLDDGTLVFGSREGASWWNAETGALLRVFDGLVRAVSVSRDGRMIAGVDGTRNVLRYDLRDGRALGPLVGADVDLWTRVAFTRDARHLVVAAHGAAPLSLFDAQTGAFLRALHEDLVGWRDLVVSRDGRTLAAATDAGAVRRFSTETWDELSPLRGYVDPTIYTSLASARDGSWILCGVGMERRHPDEPEARWKADAVARNAHAALSPDDRVVAVGAVGAVWRFDAETGARLVDGGHGDAVGFVRRAQDGAVVTTSVSSPPEVLRWRDDVSSPEPVTLPCAGAPVDLSYDATRIVLRDDVGVLHVVALDGRSEVERVLPRPGGDARFTSDGRLVHASERRFSWVPPGAAEELHIGDLPERLEAVSFDGARFVTRDVGVVVCRAADGARVCVFKHPSGFTGAVLSRDNAIACTLGADGLRLWDALDGSQRGKVLRVHPAQQKGVRATCLALSPDGLFAVVGDTDGALHGVDWASRRVTPLGHAHRGGVVRLAFEDDALLSAGCDTTALAWDVAALRARCARKVRARR